MNKEDYFDEEIAISELLQEGILFCSSRKYIDIDFIPKPNAVRQDGGGYLLSDMDCVDGKASDKETIILFVNCNDVFAWGCADAEEIPLSELKNLYDLYIKDKYGVTKWCCKQRNEKPQAPLVEMMTKDGLWDAEMEALPDNGYDRRLKEIHANKTV